MFVKTFRKVCCIMFSKWGGAMSKNEAQIGVRTTVELKKRLEVQAKKEKRTLSNLIIKILEEYLDREEEKE